MYDPYPITLYYDNGSVAIIYDAEGWRESPGTGIVAASWPDDDCTIDYTYGRSYYFIAPDGWEYAGRPVSGDAGGLLDYLHTLGISSRSPDSFTIPELHSLGIKLGRMVTTKTYATIIKPILRSTKVTTRPINLPERNLV